MGQATTAENKRGRDEVRWYVMSVPSCHRGPAFKGLRDEIDRRCDAGETPFEYFSPTYVEVVRKNGVLVKTDKPLFYNYVFIHASETEIFRIKRSHPLYSFLPKVKDGRGEHYPYIDDKGMKNLRWIAASYANVLPVYVPDPGRILKGDKVRITAGRFKGAEATVTIAPGGGQKEIVVSVDGWMVVPLMHVREGEYEVISLDARDGHIYTRLDNERYSTGLHQAMGRHCRAKSGQDPAGPTPADIQLAEEVVRQYGCLRLDTDVMKIKLYSLLLPAYTILGDKENTDRLHCLMRDMIPSVKASQSKAALLLTLYGCTDSVIHHESAHKLIDPWRAETRPKKSKLSLIGRLDDYDLWLGHK